MTELVRTVLRRQLWWVELRELQREGLGNAIKRSRIQRRIDRTPPMLTDQSGPIEVRVLTWRRDWRNAIWAIKSFYTQAGVTYPLFLHDGGLKPWQIKKLCHHFPNATFLPKDDSDRSVESILEKRGLERCLRYRRKNGVTRKLFDFFLLSNADHLITLDSDVLFFKAPRELIGPNGRNLYARDSDYFYSMSAEDIHAGIGVRPIPFLNPGPSVVRRQSIDFDLIERALHLDQMFEDNWVTEQTLHAICSTVYGSDYLPPTYVVEPTPGHPAKLVCKHYPGLYRQRLYEEGMAHLVDGGFIDRLARRGERRL